MKFKMPIPKPPPFFTCAQAQLDTLRDEMTYIGRFSWFQPEFDEPKIPHVVFGFVLPKIGKDSKIEVAYITKDGTSLTVAGPQIFPVNKEGNIVHCLLAGEILFEDFGSQKFQLIVNDSVKHEWVVDLRRPPSGSL